MSEIVSIVALHFSDWPPGGSSGSVSSFKSLHGEQCDSISFSSLQMLVRTTNSNCAKCRRSCRAHVQLRRTHFRAVEFYHDCAECNTTTAFVGEAFDQLQQFLRRCGAVATIASFPSTEQHHRYCALMGLPNYLKLRAKGTRTLMEAEIAPSI